VEPDLFGLELVERDAGVLQSSVELCRFRPAPAAHWAVARVPEPHQIRSARRADCGWMATPALTPVRAGSVVATAAPLIAARKVSVLLRALSASVWSSAAR
jgi:hypothetical protein